ncbi:hypothetical protein Pcinc_029322 [Petrolisthes cinctipes]|uniref:Uncharacterized protein n=1 Tax=Petrolisthes cinctipes TaxID=88211 RepID=A0AAE1F189_PETCI|nr:hypothetical protein Pcinc_029322 [Petrolisthes cinctipes]
MRKGGGVIVVRRARSVISVRNEKNNRPLLPTLTLPAVRLCGGRREDGIIGVLEGERGMRGSGVVEEDWKIRGSGGEGSEVVVEDWGLRGSGVECGGEEAGI